MNDALIQYYRGLRGTSCRGLGEFTISTPGGKKTFTDEADYNRFKQYVNQYDTAYGIAYSYNLTQPNWADFEAGNGEAVIDAYRAAAAGKTQVNTAPFVNASTNTITYSVLLPVDGNKTFKTTDKEEYEAYTRYVSLFNECFSIAQKYGFEKPVWAQFEAGQGENILQQYKTLEANKLTADREEAARIAQAAAERAKAEADAAAALAAQKAAAAEVTAATQAGDAKAQQDAQAALAETMQKVQEAAEVFQQAAAEDVTYTPPATTPPPTTKGGGNWWKWLLGIAAGGGILYLATRGGKSKGKKRKR